jgi:cysteine desulfurase
VGFGEACRIARLERPRETKRIAALRLRLKKGLIEKGIRFHVNGSEKARLPNNLNICLEGVRSSELFEQIPDIALSSGSACLSTSPDPSHVLKAIGVREDLKWGAVRFGIGRFTTPADIDYTIRRLASVLLPKAKKV